MTHRRERIDIEAEGLVSLASDRENPAFLFRRELLVELRIEPSDLVDASSFVLTEIQDDEAFLDHPRYGTAVFLTHALSSLGGDLERNQVSPFGSADRRSEDAAPSQVYDSVRIL